MSEAPNMPKTPAEVGDKSDAVFYLRAAEAPVVQIEALDHTVLDSHLETRVLLPGPKASVLEFHLLKGQVIPPHVSAHESINYLVRGKARVSLGRESYSAEARDAWSHAAGVETSLAAAEDCVLLQWMSPPAVLSKSRLITWGTAHPSDSHLFASWAEVAQFRLQRVEGETLFGPPGVDVDHQLKILIPGPYGSLLWNSHRKGKWALHTHQHHWLVYLLSGTMKAKFGGAHEFIAQPGDVWAAQAGAEHSNEALEDNEVVEFKWPAPMFWQGIIHSWDK